MFIFFVAVKCPLALPNGEITGDCNVTVGSTCNFKCNDGSASSSSNITCNYQGKWLTENVCLGKLNVYFNITVHYYKSTLRNIHLKLHTVNPHRSKILVY